MKHLYQKIIVLIAVIYELGTIFLFVFKKISAKQFIMFTAISVLLIVSMKLSISEIEKRSKINS